VNDNILFTDHNIRLQNNQFNLMNYATTADATSGNQRMSSRSSMLIAEWIMNKVMNDNAASTATEAPTTTDTPPSSHDTILQQLLDQASDVRRTFEQSPSASKRKHTVSSATAAAALHMASINRKRKFESRLPSSFDSATTKKTSNKFQRPISMYPICVPTSEQTHAAKDEVSNSFVSKQILPKDLTYNDVVFFGPDYDTSHVGNQRFKVWIDIHKSSFARASTHDDKTLVATSLVNTVMSSVPSGRFFSVSMHVSGTTDLRYNKLGYDKSVEIVMESLSTTVDELFKSMIIKKEPSEAVVLEEKKSCDMPPLKQTAGSCDIKEALRLATPTVKETVFRRHSSMVSLDCSAHSK